MGTLTDNRILAAIQPVRQLLDTTAAIAGVSAEPGSTVEPGTPSLPIQIEAVRQLLITLSGVDNYPDVFTTRTNMRNDTLRVRANGADQRLAAAEQALGSQQAVNDAQEAMLRELVASQGATSTRLEELRARLDLVKAVGQNLAADLAANQAHDAEQDARLTAAESRLAADARALAELQAQATSEATALAANTAADKLLAAQLASTQAVAAAALALGQAEHLTNVAQQTQLDANTAKIALEAAQQQADEQAIAAAQATATQALQLAQADAAAAATAQAAAQQAQATATAAGQAAAAAQASATAAQARADQAEADAQAAKTAAAAAQTKADADGVAAQQAQATATAAQQAAASNATALAAVQQAVAGKLDASLVRRGTVTLPAVTIVVATPATVLVTFAMPFADANYEVFLSKPGAGLLGVELGWLTKTKDGFTLTERNTGAVSLAVPAGSADYFAIHN